MRDRSFNLIMWVSDHAMRRPQLARKLVTAQCLLLCLRALALGGEINGGFEDAAGGAIPPKWEIGTSWGKVPRGATYTVDTSVAHSGKASLRVTSPGAEGIPAIAMCRAPVEANTRYVLSAYMRSDAAGADAELLSVSADYKAVDRVAVVLTPEWRRYQLVFATGDKPAATYFLRFDLHGKGKLWIDDVSLRTLSQATDDSAAIGYRYRGSHGGRDVKITVGGPTGQTLPNINGVCYHRGFGAQALDPRFADLNLKVVRLHNVLSHQKMLRRKPGGGFTYDYTLLDKSIDEILATGAVPEMNLCFVPLEMVNDPDSAKIVGEYYLGPPSDQAAWDACIHDLVRHCAGKYPNVADWYWIFGNEPEIAQFSMGTQEQYFELYRRTVAAATRALPQVRIGAGAFAHRYWLEDFIERCAATGTRVDLISWHHYGLVAEDYAGKIARVRALLAAHPSLGKPELIIDEWNPLLPDKRPAYYSAGNYASAHAAPSIYAMMKSGLAYQTFFIAHSPFGWGMLGRDGTRHPTFNLFELMGRMGTGELEIRVPDDEPYIGGFATRKEDGTITVLIWYTKSLNDVSPDVEKRVTVRLDGSASAGAVTRYLIDRTHSNGLEDARRQALETANVEVRAASDSKAVDLEYTASTNSVSLLVVKPD